MSNHNCRVCGLYCDDLPWGDDEKSPTYIICSCCGVEFGNEDYTLQSLQKFRAAWLESGAKWFRQKEKPSDWSLDEQLKNVLLKYK
jgi:hypothetical protein